MSFWANPAVIGGLISAGGQLLGGILDRKQSGENSQANIDMQRDFAQQGIRWRVADAEAAGIHPLYALGASGASFSPSVNVGSMGPALASAGQDIGRAISAGRSQTERVQDAAVYNPLMHLQEQRLQLENEGLMLRNARLSQELVNQPPIPEVASSSIREFSPIPAGGTWNGPLVGGLVKVKPSEVTSPAPGVLGRSAGTNPGFDRFSVGGSRPGFVDLPGSKLAESLEGMGALGHLIGPVLLAYHEANKYLGGTEFPKMDPPSGHRWEWSVLSQSWKPVPVNRAPSGGSFKRTHVPY